MEAKDETLAASGSHAVEPPRLDAMDRRILDILQRDARRSRAEIGQDVGLSAAAVHERIKKLERSGVIKGYAALLDPERAQCDLLAFVEVFIDEPQHEGVFLQEVARIGEIQECHRVTGKATCILKVRVRHRRALQRLILDRINAIPGVRGTETVVVLSTTKETPHIHLAGETGLPSERPAAEGGRPTGD
ncbi:MAG TPA: Lrp/AsnC family transcriptional regulator [Acidobacteriota bacterium]|nr:Lrp/AsnC family transcriptional regulator [bacterium]HNX20355.1 Lrp/AsnC family transcriptional regulator [Acidobacteriota bacterium]